VKKHVVVILLIVLVASSCFSDEQPRPECVRLKNLGENVEMVDRLRKWLESSWEDASFASIFNNTSHVHALGNSELFSSITLDWEFYGIRKEVGSMTISKSRHNSDLPNWFSVGEVRSSLYLEYFGTGVLTESDWINVSKGVYLRCE